MYVFPVPFTCISYGSTGTGKTFIVHEFIKYQKEMTSSGGFQKIYYFYGSFQPRFSNPIAENLQYIEGFPSPEFFEREEIKNPDIPILIVLDDLLMKSHNNPVLVDLFTQESHHKNLSVIYMINNLYHPSKNLPTVRRNTFVFLLQVTQRDVAPISNLSRQLIPQRPKDIIDAYEISLKHLNPETNIYSTLLVDIFPHTPPEKRILENFLPTNEYMIVYVPNEFNAMNVFS